MFGGWLAPEENEVDKKKDPFKKKFRYAYIRKEKDENENKNQKKRVKQKITENSKARGKRMPRPKREKEDPSDQAKRGNKNLHLVFRGPQQQLAKLNLIAVVVQILNEEK